MKQYKHRIGKKGKYFMFGNFTEDARQILMNAKSEMKNLNHPYVGSEHLVLAILKDDNPISRKLKSYHLDYETFKNELIEIVGIGHEASHWFLYTPLLKRVMENAIIDSKENNNGVVTVEHLFASLLEEGEGVAIRILLGMNIDIDELYNEFAYKLTTTAKHKKSKKMLLEELGTDLTAQALNGAFDPVIGREKEINRVLEILSRRTKNNPLLIGDAGVGKTAIVEELSRKIVNGEVPPSLKNKRIISLEMATMVAGTKYRGEFEERMRKILKEIEDNEDVILFIDEIHTLVGAGGAEGAIDASNIFKPALARGKLRCIGATTTEEYKKYIEMDGALDRRFQSVYIEVPNTTVVKSILMKLKGIYEQYHLVKISEAMIDLIITFSEKYIHNRNQPDKAIDILDEVCAKVSLKESKELKKYHELNRTLQNTIKEKNEAIINNEFKEASRWKEKENHLMNQINELELELLKQKHNKIVTKEDIAEVIHIKTKVPVYELLKENKKAVEELKEHLISQIVGQDEAIEKVVQVAKRLKMGFKEEEKGTSFLFVGPSGVGKTALAKLFGKELVGEANVIRLDMSEYGEAHSVSKLVGAPPGYVGYDSHKNILEEIRNKPYSVLLLDEIERAHPAVLNLFFQILEEGKIKDSKGTTIYFGNVTILMTSNIGFEEVTVGFQNQKQEFIFSKLKENFSVPFINRIDEIIVFQPLSKENIVLLTQKKLENLQKQYKKKGYHISYSPDLITEITEKSEYQEYGARRLDKIIKENLESKIIECALENQTDIFLSHLTRDKIEN